MSKYFIADAPGYCGDWCKVHSVHDTLKEALRAAKCSPAVRVLVDPYDDFEAGERYPTRQVNMHEPRPIVEEPAMGRWVAGR